MRAFASMKLLEQRINRTQQLMDNAMATFKCETCGAFDSRYCNGDNEVCLTCGTPDDFTEISEEEFEQANEDAKYEEQTRSVPQSL